MNKYETTFILEPGLDEGRVNEEIDKVSGWIRDLGGDVTEVQRWGKRRLSYEIRRRRDGIYTMIVYEAPGDAVKEVERRLKLNEAVMRVLSVLYVPPELTHSQADPDAPEGASAPAAAESGDE